jgi:hypothetical protein
MPSKKYSPIPEVIQEKDAGPSDALFPWHASCHSKSMESSRETMAAGKKQVEIKRIGATGKKIARFAKR